MVRIYSILAFFLCFGCSSTNSPSIQQYFGKWTNTKIIYHENWDEEDRVLGDGNFVVLKENEIIEIFSNAPSRAYPAKWDGLNATINSGGTFYTWDITPIDSNEIHIKNKIGTYILIKASTTTE